MLNDIGFFLDSSKRTDLIKRLENKDVDQSLPAEIELALTWMLKDEDDVEVEPYWWATSRRPDVYIDNFLEGRPAVVEIACVSDNSMSGSADMDKCSRSFVEIANQLQKGVGDYLYFSFQEYRTRDHGRSVRNISAPKNYRPSNKAINYFREWIISGKSQLEKIHIKDGDLSVIVSRHPVRHPRLHNFHTSRPSRVYSDTSNPIYKQLKTKAQQISDSPRGALRLIFLGEVGSAILAELAVKYRMGLFEDYSKPDTIIKKFLTDKKGHIDAVVAFIPVSKINFYGGASERYWSMSIFADNEILRGKLQPKLELLLGLLPSPRMAGYQARSKHIQKTTNYLSNVSYLGTSIRSKNNEVSMKISSRVLQDFIAGKISAEQFRYFIGEQEDGLSFRKLLDNGFTISAMRLERQGIDKDDDYVVFEFERDPAAGNFS